MALLVLKYATMIAYFVVLAGLMAFGLHRYFLVYLFRRHRKQAPVAAGRFDDLPRVTVQLPVFNERYVVERLIRAVAALDYPKDKLEIQVLDDSTDDTVDISRRVAAELAAEGFRIAVLHRRDRAGYKAGALQAGLEVATGELIAIFDADFVPQPDFLQKTVHHFTDPAVGMVQVRWSHLNADYSLVTRAQAIFLDGHFVVEHAARNRSGRYFNFNGTAGIWRRQAIEDAGGWEHDTLTEDLDLSYRAQMAGWRFAYLLDVEAPGEIPVEIASFKTQQHRWAKGSIETARKILPRLWRSDRPLAVKLEATFHLGGNLAYPLVIALALLTLPGLVVRINMHWQELAILDLVIFAGATVPIALFYGLSQKAIREDWRKSLWYFPFLMALGIGLAVNNGKAVWEGLTGARSAFVRTPKYRIESRRDRWRRKDYRVLPSGTTWVELALFVYSLVPVAFAAAYRVWASIPFLLLFTVGFGYVAGVAILQSAGAASGAHGILRPTEDAGSGT